MHYDSHVTQVCWLLLTESRREGVRILNDLASMYIRQQRYDDAESPLRRALNLAQQQPATCGRLAADVRSNLAQLYRETGRAAVANATTPAQPERADREPDRGEKRSGSASHAKQAFFLDRPCSREEALPGARSTPDA